MLVRVLLSELHAVRWPQQSESSTVQCLCSPRPELLVAAFKTVRSLKTRQGRSALPNGVVILKTVKCLSALTVGVTVSVSP